MAAAVTTTETAILTADIHRIRVTTDQEIRDGKRTHGLVSNALFWMTLPSRFCLAGTINAVAGVPFATRPEPITTAIALLPMASITISKRVVSVIEMIENLTSRRLPLPPRRMRTYIVATEGAQGEDKLITMDPRPLATTITRGILTTTEL